MTLHESLNSIISSTGLSESFIFFLPRIFIALICGTIIGLERELFNKSAGMKTLMLVCLGSTLFATLSFFLEGIDPSAKIDKTRIIAQIVSGIGFLGAGVILQSKGGITGMTSAANIWFTGAIGCIIGVGEFELAISLSFISVFFLISFRWFERLINRNYENAMPHFYHLKISCDPKSNGDLYSYVQKLIKDHGGVIKHSNFKKMNGTSKNIDMKYSCLQKNHDNLIKEIQSQEGIINIDLDEYAKES